MIYRLCVGFPNVQGARPCSAAFPTVQGSRLSKVPDHDHCNSSAKTMILEPTFLTSLPSENVATTRPSAPIKKFNRRTQSRAYKAKVICSLVGSDYFFDFM